MNSFKSMPDWLWRLQARYGSTAASFFNFLRNMILLNFVNSILILGLIMVPQLVPHDTNITVIEFDVTYYNYKNSSSRFYELNEDHSEHCSSHYLEMYSFKRYNTTENATVWTDLQDYAIQFLQGRVKMEQIQLTAKVMGVIHSRLKCLGGVPVL